MCGIDVRKRAFHTLEKCKEFFVWFSGSDECVEKCEEIRCSQFHTSKMWGNWRWAGEMWGNPFLTSENVRKYSKSLLAINFNVRKMWGIFHMCGIDVRKRAAFGPQTPKTRGKTNPPKPGSIRIHRGSVRIFEDPWIRGSRKKKCQPSWNARCPIPGGPRPRQLRAWHVDLARSTAAICACNMLFTRIVTCSTCMHRSCTIEPGLPVHCWGKLAWLLKVASGQQISAESLIDDVFSLSSFRNAQWNQWLSLKVQVQPVLRCVLALWSFFEISSGQKATCLSPLPKSACLQGRNSEQINVSGAHAIQWQAHQIKEWVCWRGDSKQRKHGPPGCSSGSRGGGGGRGDAPPPPHAGQKKKKKEKGKKRAFPDKSSYFRMFCMQVLKLLLVTPVTTASVERANSALGFIKSDHRSTMSEGRLNALLRLYVHKDIPLDFQEVVTAYGHKHPRRMLLGWPLDAWFSSSWTSSSWSSWSSQWLQILCKILWIYVQITLKIRSLIFLKLYPKIVKMHICASQFSKFPGGACPRTP